ncbi:uncharacterized protein LOC127752145 [Frankliniella occidentalis]|uniref:Uncharacterized protein LOC127752145 n=1 Tax=Frankliniella occidentalis TaxID=133901 RepID=A0A9C6XBN9_FRAOC|nr:uncharacterized protein LOC127752145 [Frankliniella occidentalis]
MASTLVALALMCSVGIHGRAINSVIGPYIAYAERYYMCEPDNRPLPWRWWVRTTHFNPVRPKVLPRITGNMTSTSGDLDDSVWVKTIVDVRSNNQWKENAFVFKFNNKACQIAKVNSPGWYEVVLKKREVKGACIFKPGVYEFHDAPIDWNFPNVPIMPYGHYRARVMIGKAENLYACWVIEAKAVPKVDQHFHLYGSYPIYLTAFAQMCGSNRGLA